MLIVWILLNHDLAPTNNVDSVFGVGNLAVTEVVDGLAFVFVAKRFVFVNFLNASGVGIVVGLAIDVGLIELDAVGPLLGSAFFAPREPVACPVTGGCAADGSRTRYPALLCGWREPGTNRSFR